ncbi:hypothetical protein QCA50_015179 [Cerrena zonata]|uniref:Uncharacterized protein n=1 Tax=Cerrena zonata TaxID=2478898 RepID=A0AAW0FNW4_9APHY
MRREVLVGLGVGSVGIAWFVMLLLSPDMEGDADTFTDGELIDVSNLLNANIQIADLSVTECAGHFAYRNDWQQDPHFHIQIDPHEPSRLPFASSLPGT